MEKCKTCINYGNCEHLKKGEVCKDNIYSTAYETTSEFFKGETTELEIRPNDYDIRLDLVMNKQKISKLWGQVKDERGHIIEDALVTLLKPKYIRGIVEYLPVATTLTDCLGFYQFEIDKLETGLKYRVSISKS